MRSDNPQQRSRANETISAAYWKPIYKYVRLKWNLSGEDAQDFTQEFFLRLIDKGFLDSFDPAKGRLRTFLRTCADRLFLNQTRDAQRHKRAAGNLLPVDFDEAEQEFAKGTGFDSQLVPDGIQSRHERLDALDVVGHSPRHPPVAEAQRPPERGVGVTAEEDRRVRPGHGLGLEVAALVEALTSVPSPSRERGT